MESKMKRKKEFTSGLSLDRLLAFVARARFISSVHEVQDEIL